MNGLSASKVELYSSSIGTSRDDLVTPALILDLDAAERNIATMARAMEARPTCNRPHVKVHKSPDLARLQVAAGAIGICTATVWEALVMARAGIRDVLIANEVVGDEKVAVAMQAAAEASLSVLVDDQGNVDELAAAAAARGVELGILVDFDTGMGRCGVRDASQAIAIADRVTRHASLRLRGLQGYEGHCTAVLDSPRRTAMAQEANERLADVAAALRNAGFECDVVSAGGTCTWQVTGADPRITEIQAGSYVLMDTFHRAFAPEFEIALTVLATVVSRQGQTVVLDAGNKSVTPVESDCSPILGCDCRAIRYDEEHAILKAGDGFSPAIGDKLELVSGYTPATVNLYDIYHVVRGDCVVDVWPVTPRGPGHDGMLSSVIARR